MNKLFIIGNGFDLAHGLKTSYSDFILWLHKETINNAVDLVKYLTYDRKIFSYTDGFMSVNINASTAVKESFISVLKSCNEADSKNSLIDMFPLYQDKPCIKFTYHYTFLENLFESFEENKWVDIEYAYYSSVVKIYKRYEKNENIDFKPHEKDVIELNEILDYLKRNLINYLKTIDVESVKLNEETKANIYKELDTNKLKLFTGVMFLNFNYTSTIKKYINSDNWKTINNIHGETENEKNPVIFGFGDEMNPYYEKIENTNSGEILNHFKSFYYLKTNNYKDLLSFIGSPYEIVILGHSCGLSDRLLLNTIFENENCKSIKIYFYQKSLFENDYFVKTQEISRHFTLKAKKDVRKKIVSFDFCKPLVSFIEKTAN